MTEDQRPRPGRGEHYQIRIDGHLDAGWSEWFDGLVITHEQVGTTLLAGSVVDQPALHGLLNTVRDLGLALISVHRTQPEE